MSMKPRHASTGAISIVVTTYGTQSFYTQACLESIRRWKNWHHELVVVAHDESSLLRAYLDACAADGLIDRLIYAEPNHGHTRSFNLAVQQSVGDVVFHVANDILVGPSVVDYCARELRQDPQLGIVGWHWYNEGTFWDGDRIREFAWLDSTRPMLPDEHVRNIRDAPWYTGRYFEAVGGPKWIQLCNTAFFGIRRELLDRVGGGFGAQYHHYWADDFLCYAVLDQGLDVRNFNRRFRSREFFHEFQYDQTDVEDRRRNADMLCCDAPSLQSVRLINGGLSNQESTYLYTLGRSIPDGSSVTNIGVWLGASALIVMDALREKRITFHVVDCFDLPGVSAMSGQPPVTEDDFLNWVGPYLGRSHRLQLIKADTRGLDRFPPSDFVFVDAGHTKECIEHDARLVRDCLLPGGIAAFHDYGCPAWPDVKPAVDEVFERVETYGTVAVAREKQAKRTCFRWPHER